ncbi:hypothetical protein ACVXG7_17585 [Enterobacter hormaechei]
MAILLNDKPRQQRRTGDHAGAQNQGVHAKLLYSRMGEVTADDGSSCRLPRPSPEHRR